MASAYVRPQLTLLIVTFLNQKTSRGESFEHFRGKHKEQAKTCQLINLEDTFIRYFFLIMC